MRTGNDLDVLIMAARLRRERRLAPVLRAQEGYPNAALWRKLDLVHEATYLVDRLESRRAEAENRAAEQGMRA